MENFTFRINGSEPNNQPQVSPASPAVPEVATPVVPAVGQAATFAPPASPATFPQPASPAQPVAPAPIVDSFSPIAVNPSFTEPTPVATATPESLGISQDISRPSVPAASIAPEVPAVMPALQSLDAAPAETPAPIGGNSTYGQQPPQKRSFAFPAWLKIVAIVLLVLLLLGGLVWALSLRGNQVNNGTDVRSVGSQYDTLELPLDDLLQQGALLLSDDRKLTVNGQLQANNTLIIAPTSQPQNAVSGQIYYDSGTNQLAYYNGTVFVPLINQEITAPAIQGVGGGLALVDGVATNTGVLSVQGQNGAVTFTGGDGIGVDGTSISNTGVTSLGGQTGDVGLGSGIGINSGALTNTGVISLTAGTPNLVIANDGNGNLTISNVGGGTGTVTSGGGNSGRIAMFTGAQNIEDSSISEAAGTVTVNGNLNVTGTLGLSSALSVINGGTGATALTANGVLIGNGTSPVTAVTAGGTGLCLMSTAGAPVFQACPGGGGGVTSLNGAAGALSIANATESGGVITINDASTTQKGIASFNSTNFSVASGAVNTIQNINTAATPTFAGVNTNSINPSGALTVGATTQNLSLQGSNTTLSEQNGANTASLTFAAPTANVTYQLQTAAAGTYDVCTTAGNCTSLGGAVTTPGGTTNQLAKFTGSQAIADSIISDDGSLVTVAGDLTVTGVTTLTTPLAITSGGTGANSAGGARTNLGAAASGANSDITSLSGLTTALSVVQGGTGTTALTANGILLGNGTSPISSLVAGGAGQCLVSTAGAPVWQACPGSGGVSSVNGQTGALTIANAVGAAGTITINDASTSQKGIAQFNSTNFTAASGTINTIQDINTTAAPTFGRLTLTSSQASNPMLLVNNTNAGATGNLLDLQLNGASRLAVTPSGNMTLSGTINGQSISSTASFTGTLAVAGLASLNGGAAVTGTLTANTITPTGALTVGATNQSFLLQGSAGSTITATSGANTTTVSFQTPTANVNYRLLTAAAGTYDICTSVGNCAGTGGGVTTPGGTTNTLAKFTGSQTLGDSIITDDGSTVGIGGTLAVNTITPTGALTIGSTSQDLTLQGTSTTLSATDAGFTNTLQFATPSGSNKTITIPNASGTVAVSATGPIQVDSSGNITCPQCVTSGGGGGGQGAVDSLNGLSGALTLANATGIGSTVTIDDASTSQKGIAQFNSTNFTASGGVINTIQDINTTAAPTFGRLTLTSSQASNDMLTINNTNAGATGSLLKLQLNGANRFTVDPSGNVVTSGTISSGAINGQTISSAANFTGTMAVAGLATLNGGATVNGTLTANAITSTAAMTVGSTSQNLVLQGAATSLSATDSGNTTTLNFETPTANVTYRLLTAAAGSYDICTTAGNCVGGGGGVTTSGGTTGRIAKFTGSQTIGDSLLSESGSVVSVAGGLNLASGNQYQINGTQISSADLSNNANLAKLDATQTFTGATNTFRNTTDSASAFAVQNAAGRSVLNANTTTGAVTLGNVTSTPGEGVAGVLRLADGTNDNFAMTLNTTTLTADRTINLPNESGVVCLQTSTACGFALASGSGNYIQNGTTPQSSNFYVQAATSGSVAATIRANAAGTGNILNLLDGAGTTVARVGSAGAALFRNSTNTNFGLEVQDASSNGIIRVDTTSRKVGIGAYSSALVDNLTGQLQVLPINDGRVGINIKGFSPTYSASYLQIVDSADNNMFRVQSNGDVLTSTGVFTSNTQSAASTNSATGTFGSGSVSGATSNSGSVTFRSGNSTTSGNTGSVTLQSGNATSGNSGNLTIDSGTATGTAGSVNIGGTNASGTNIGRATTTTAITGNLTQGTGSFNLNGTSTSALSVTGSLNMTASGSSTWQTTAGDLVLQAAGTGSELVLDNISSGGTIRIGNNTNNARTVEVGVGTNGSQAQTVTVGSAGGTSTTTIQGGSGATAIALNTGSGGDINLTTTGAGGDINLLTASKVLVRSTTNSTTAFQIQPSATTPVLFNADTTNNRIGIGTATPRSDLDLGAAGAKLTVGTVGGGGSLNFGDTADTNAITYLSNGLNFYTSQSNGFRFYTDSDTDPSGTPEFQVTDAGAAIFRNNTNSTGGFLIQNAAGNSFFRADTSNQRIGIGLATPATALDVQGIAQQTGLTTLNTGASDNNKWSKLASCNITTQYQSCVTKFLVIGGRSGDDNKTSQTTITARVKQQNAMGGAPHVDLYIGDATDILIKEDIVAVTTQNDGAGTVVEVYGRITNIFEEWSFVPTINTGDVKWAWYNQSAFLTSLPAGTQNVSIGANSVFGITTIDGGNNNYTQRLCHNQINGSMINLTLGDCQDTGQADLAEFYATEGGVEPGDIVAPSSTGNYTVAKTTQPHQQSAVGVASTNPIADGIIGHNVTDSSRQPIALAGRVPLKVSLENGPIAIGDPLTSSSTPGVAMKATGKGVIIGTALEGYDENSPRVSSLVTAEEVNRDTAHRGALPMYRSNPANWQADVGKIMFFIRPSYVDASQQLQGSTSYQDLQVQGELTAGSLNVSGNASVASLEVRGVAVIERLEVQQVVIAADLTVNGHIISGGATPVVTAQTICGASATIEGTDTAGVITVVTTAGCTPSGKLVGVEFSRAFEAKPNVTLTSANAKAASISTYVDGGATTPQGFSIATDSAMTADTYKWYYQVIQ